MTRVIEVFYSLSMNISALFVLSLIGFQIPFAWGESSLETQVVYNITDNPAVTCHWVDKVGDTQEPANVDWVDFGPSCTIKSNDGQRPRKASGLCKGIIRCAGMGSGWGDIYFEDVHCPSAREGGKAFCGRRGDRMVANRKFSEGIKSCLSFFILSEGEVKTFGSDQTIKQVPKKVEIAK
ncbi:MAG: hypothetical protein KDD22_05750 [Bdellovibrionales bacterium]|nr:hypothetical protein [Bdellovibrionales bacterium]